MLGVEFRYVCCKQHCDVFVIEPVLQWSLGNKVSTPPSVDPVKIAISSTPCSRDVKVLAAQFSAGYVDELSVTKLTNPTSLQTPQSTCNNNIYLL